MSMARRPCVGGDLDPSPDAGGVAHRGGTLCEGRSRGTRANPCPMPGDMATPDVKSPDRSLPAHRTPAEPWAFPFLAVLFVACSGATPAEQNPFPWNPGHYAFSGSCSYRNDTPQSERTEQLDSRAGSASVGIRSVVPERTGSGFDA